MKTSSNRYRVKETDSYAKLLDKYRPGRFTAVIILVFVIVLSVLTMITERPEAFYMCHVVLIVATVGLLTGNSSFNSIALAALPLYVVVCSMGFVLIHFVDLGLLIAVLVLSRRRIQPGIMMIASVFYALYIYAFIESINPEYGEKDPFNAAYNVVYAIVIVVTATLLAALLKSIWKVRWFTWLK